MIICLSVSNICFTQIEGCTDPEAYNCADDVLLDGNEYPNYIFEIGGILYANSCNYILNDYSEIIYEGGCENNPCEGYYDPKANTDDGSFCRYYHAPHNEDVVFTISDNGINVDWSTFSPPVSATLVSYHVQRCVGTSCTWLPGFGPTDVNTQTLSFDEIVSNFNDSDNLKNLMLDQLSEVPVEEPE